MCAESTTADLELTTRERNRLNTLARHRCFAGWGTVALFVAGFIVIGHGLWQFHQGAISGLPALGDYAGSLGSALWAAAGIGLIYLAFAGQQEELIYQRAELRATQKTMKGQETQMQAQTGLIAQQAFDGSFYRLLEFHRQHLSTMAIVSPRSPFASPRSRPPDDVFGRDCFPLFLSYFRQAYATAIHLFKEGRILVPTSGDVYNARHAAEASLTEFWDGYTVREYKSEWHDSVIALCTRNAAKSLLSHFEAQLKPYLTNFSVLAGEVNFASRHALLDGTRYINLVAGQLTSDEHDVIAIASLVPEFSELSLAFLFIDDWTVSDPRLEHQFGLASKITSQPPPRSWLE